MKIPSLMKTICLVLVVLGAIITPTYAKAAPDGGVQFNETGAQINNIGGCDGTVDSPVCTDINDTTNPLFGPTGILTKAADIFALVTGIISVFMMLIGGLRYINSAGDASKVNSAKNTIMYSAIGIAVASSAAVIAKFVLSRL